MNWPVSVRLRRPFISILLNILLRRRRETARPFEIFEQRLPPPARVPQCLPGVIVDGGPAVPSHAIDGRAATNNISNAEIRDPAAEMDLRNGGHIVEARGLVACGQERDCNIDSVSKVAVLDNKHSLVRGLSESGGDNEATGAAADNNVVILIMDRV